MSECRRAAGGGFWLGRVFRYARTVMGTMIFIGFTAQIGLGAVWLCCNFAKVQDFGWRNLGRTKPEGAIYALYGFLGRIPPILYLTQLGLAFFAGYRFLRMAGGLSARSGRRTFFCLWGSLALLTFPFAMQCHLAVLPYSAMSSLFLLMLSFLLEAVSGKGTAKTLTKLCAPNEAACAPAPGKLSGRKLGMAAAGLGRRWTHLRPLALAAVCGILTVTLALEAGADEREAVWGRGADAALASRTAWPSVWNDREYWSEELRGLISEEELWQAAYCPGNMEIVLEAVEQRAGDAAGDAYREMAKVAWKLRRPMILRQIAWDALGFGAFPLVFDMQLEGRMYDSYTGRNYEVMREHAPALTGYYAEYGCWWFVCCLVLGALLTLTWVAQKRIGKRQLLGAGVCVLMGALAVLAYTMRGAGLMDYRCTVAISQLWLAWAILSLGDNGGKRNGNVGG